MTLALPRRPTFGLESPGAILGLQRQLSGLWHACSLLRCSWPALAPPMSSPLPVPVFGSCLFRLLAVLLASIEIQVSWQLVQVACLYKLSSIDPWRPLNLELFGRRDLSRSPSINTASATTRLEHHSRVRLESATQSKAELTTGVRLTIGETQERGQRDNHDDALEVSLVSVDQQTKPKTKIIFTEQYYSRNPCDTGGQMVKVEIVSDCQRRLRLRTDV